MLFVAPVNVTLQTFVGNAFTIWKSPFTNKFPFIVKLWIAAKAPTFMVLPASIWTSPVTFIVLTAAALPIVNVELFVTNKFPVIDVVLAVPPRVVIVPEIFISRVIFTAAVGVNNAVLPEIL